jgi:hypothetical protein
MGRKKAKSGTWVTRELLRSAAFWALSSTAKGLLFQFLLKRDIDKQHNCLNCKSLTLTYKELGNMFGKRPDGTCSGLARASITRGLKDLMAKGFIEIIRQGGAYQKDKSIYGLTDDWQWWHTGLVIREKQPGKKVARATHENNFNPHNRNHTHPQNRNQKSQVRVSE